MFHNSADKDFDNIIQFVKRALLFSIFMISGICILGWKVQPWLMRIPGYALAEPISTNTEVIVFGSSTLKWIESEDERGTSVLDLLSKMLPDVQLASYSDLAFSARDFEAALTGVRDWGKIRLVVVPIALRSLGPSWGSNPEYERSRQRLFLRSSNPLIIRYLAVLNWIFPKTYSKEEYEKLSVVREGRVIGIVRDFLYDDGVPEGGTEAEQMRVIANRLRFYYLTDVAADNPDLIAVSRLINLCQQKHVKVLLYIEPVNIARIQRYDGVEGVDQVKRNCLKVANIVGLNHPGLYFRDWSQLLDRDEEAFSMPYGITNEHLMLDWRKRMASILGMEVASIMNSNDRL